MRSTYEFQKNYSFKGKKCEIFRTAREFPRIGISHYSVSAAFEIGTPVALRVPRGTAFMKILIGYDGSQTADAALDDLKLAGLPDDTEVSVLTVAEVWLPPENAAENASETEPNPYLEQLTEKHRQKGKKAVAEAEVLARHAGGRLQKMFPAWRVKAEATYGSPAWEMIAKSNELKADLIVVGSHGRTALGRFFLGSISQKVLTEAHMSVRVARGRVEVDPVPSRIVIGFDGSPGAKAAVEQVAARSWREMSEVRLVMVTNPVAPSGIGRFVPPIAGLVEEELSGEREWVEKLAEDCLELLNSKNIKAKLCIHAGNPKAVLVEEAERWHADSIFVGANAFGSRLERFLLGSTSAAVAARAHCTVEVVRRVLPGSGVSAEG